MDGRERLRTIAVGLLSLGFTALGVFLMLRADTLGERLTGGACAAFFGFGVAVFIWMLVRGAPVPGRTPPPRLAFDPAKFPYPLITVPAAEAMATRARLLAEDRGAPVIIGGDASAALILSAIGRGPKPDAILRDAAGVAFPEDLLGRFADDDPEERLPDGAWPAQDPPTPDPIDGEDLFGPGPVYIALLPTDDAITAPAWLRFGGFNGSPEPAEHVAALRAWRDAYGAQVIACTHDTLLICVERGPATREEAMDLARTIHAYSDWDLNDLAELAADLMVSRQWLFWWD